MLVRIDSFWISNIGVFLVPGIFELSKPSYLLQCTGLHYPTSSEPSTHPPVITPTLDRSCANSSFVSRPKHPRENPRFAPDTGVVLLLTYDFEKSDIRLVSLSSNACLTVIALYGADDKSAPPGKYNNIWE